MPAELVVRACARRGACGRSSCAPTPWDLPSDANALTWRGGAGPPARLGFDEEEFRALTQPTERLSAPGFDEAKRHAETSERAAGRAADMAAKLFE